MKNSIALLLLLQKNLYCLKLSKKYYLY